MVEDRDAGLIPGEGAAVDPDDFAHEHGNVARPDEKGQGNASNVVPVLSLYRRSIRRVEPDEAAARSSRGGKGGW